jgi:hypothetical protein
VSLDPGCTNKGDTVAGSALKGLGPQSIFKIKQLVGHKRKPSSRPTKNTFVRSGIAALLWLTLSPAATAADAKPAIAEIAKQFDRHPLIMIGELHRSSEIHAFLQQMLRDPAFICRADDIVVEFGNSRLQGLADTYIAGGNITQAQLKSLWRETAVPLTWNSPLYQQFYETVRDINQEHLCTHSIRVLLGDPPLDWSKIKTVKDYARVTDRDGSYADVVEREVLSKHHRALLVAGELHAMKQLPKDYQSEPEEPTVAQRIERKHPGALFSIVSVPLPNAAKALNLGPAPSFSVVKGSALEDADFQLTDYDSKVTLVSVNGKQVSKLEPDKHWPPMGNVVDGLLYVGGNHSLYPSPTIYLDPVYQQELRRRALIIKNYNGQDFMPGIDELVKEGKALEKNGH